MEKEADMADKEVDKVANIEVEKVADKEVDKVANIEVEKEANMVADKEVDKVANIEVEKEADMVADKEGHICFIIFTCPLNAVDKMFNYFFLRCCRCLWQTSAVT